MIGSFVASGLLLFLTVLAGIVHSDVGFVVAAILASCMRSQRHRGVVWQASCPRC